VAFRSGFVGVVGRPNVGKSSLVNALVGTKVAIVSDKAQTTRQVVRGILTGPDFQMAFTDTPGFHKPRTHLGERLNRRVEDALADVDVLLMVVDGATGVGRGDAFVAQREVTLFAGPKVCAVNKVDLIRGRREVPELAAASGLAPFDHVVPTSARTGRGVADLRGAIADALPEGPGRFPAGQTSDQPLDLRVADLVREKALELTREELPHSIAVVTDEIERDEGTGLLRISCRLLVERESQKGMVIGRGGEMLKRIGTMTREELEALLGSKVFLDLRVKVWRDWQRDPSALDRLGL
jgi:GTP-binding protein Era